MEIYTFLAVSPLMVFRKGFTATALMINGSQEETSTVSEASTVWLATRYFIWLIQAFIWFQNHLYVIGGNNKTGGCRKDILLTEIYDIKTDQWTEARPLFEGQSEAGAAVVDGKIYVIGGHNWKERKDVRTVACYDPET